MKTAKIIETKQVAISKEAIMDWLVLQDVIEYFGDRRYRILKKRFNMDVLDTAGIDKWAYFPIEEE